MSLRRTFHGVVALASLLGCGRLGFEPLPPAPDGLPAPTTRLRFVVEPSAVAAGATMVPGVTVEILDLGGTRVTEGPNAALTVTLRLGSGDGIVAGNVSRAASAGVATFADLRLERAGDKTLVASAPAALSATSVVFAVSLPTPTAMTLLAGVPNPNGFVDGQGTAARFDSPRGLALCGGDLYVAERASHVIRKVDPAGNVSTFAGSPQQPGDALGGATEARFESPSGIACNATTLFVVDSLNRVIKQIDLGTGVVSFLAGQRGGPNFADGIGAAAAFNEPASVVLDGDDLYVADLFNHRIRRVDITTAEVSTFAGDGTCAYVDGIGQAASLCGPIHLSLASGALIVSQVYEGTARRIDIATGTVSALPQVLDGLLATTFDPLGGLLYATGRNSTVEIWDLGDGSETNLVGTSWSEGFVNATGNAARFDQPSGLAVAGGVLYVADTGNGAIRRVDLADATVSTWVGSNGPGVGLDDGVASAARFTRLQGVTSDGTYYYATDGNDAFTIRRIDPTTGEVITLAGLANTWGTVDAIGADARFNDPIGICTDGASLFVSEYYGTIRRIDLATRAVTTLAGVPESAGLIDGVGSAARFTRPDGLVCAYDSLFVMDADVLRRIDPRNGAVTTVAGHLDADDCDDGVGTAAGFTGGYNLTAQGGFIYVSNTWCFGSIRQVDPVSGVVTTLAGGGPATHQDGIGDQASFANGSLAGITSDGVYLYVIDGSGSTIRRIDPESGAVNTYLGAVYAPLDLDGPMASARISGPRATYYGFGALVVAGQHNLRELR